MTKKEKFIAMVEDLMGGDYDLSNYDPEAVEYWTVFKNSADKSDKPLLTDNGKMILKFLQDNVETEAWKAKEIGEELGISSRTVSGSIRKLCSDGFVDKVGQDPVIYSITDKGKEIDIK